MSEAYSERARRATQEHRDWCAGEGMTRLQARADEINRLLDARLEVRMSSICTYYVVGDAGHILSGNGTTGRSPRVLGQMLDFALLVARGGGRRRS